MCGGAEAPCGVAPATCGVTPSQGADTRRRGCACWGVAGQTGRCTGCGENVLPAAAGGEKVLWDAAAWPVGEVTRRLRWGLRSDSKCHAEHWRATPLGAVEASAIRRTTSCWAWRTASSTTPGDDCAAALGSPGACTTGGGDGVTALGSRGGKTKSSALPGSSCPNRDAPRGSLGEVGSPAGCDGGRPSSPKTSAPDLSTAVRAGSKALSRWARDVSKARRATCSSEMRVVRICTALTISSMFWRTSARRSATTEVPPRTLR